MLGTQNTLRFKQFKNTQNNKFKLFYLILLKKFYIV